MNNNIVMEENMALEEYRKHVANLSINEQKLRDLYLRDLALGKIQGPPTGYASLDKPWLKWYDEEAITFIPPKNTLLKHLKENVNDNIDDIAITYFGKKITYGGLFQKIDEASKALTSIGVKENDRIMYLMPNIPETAYLLYGGSQLGAVSDYVDPRPDSLDLNVSAHKILELFKSEKAKHLVVLDQCYISMIKPIEKELKELGLETVVVVSADTSMSLKEKINYLMENLKFEGYKVTKEKMLKSKLIAKKLEQAKKESCLDVVSYDDLVELSKNIDFSTPGYKEGKVDVIVHTSGTTSSRPKPITLTGDNMNNYVSQTFFANMPMSPKDRVLHILPYFAAFGIVDVVHAGFSHRNNLIQIPEFSPANLGKLIKKYKPQTIIGTPTWFLSLVDDDSLNGVDLSFLKMITYGGESMDAKDEEKVNDFLCKHGCKSTITKGHGMSEICGCGSYATGDYNVLGSMGIPMPNTIYALIDPASKEMIRFGDKDFIEGELIISSNTTTPGYLDENVVTQHVEYDGKDYIFTKDIVKMDKNGILTFLTRSDRSFTRYDGFKYKYYEIENIIKENPNIKYCIISPFYDDEKYGNMPIADIVLNSNDDLTDDEKVLVVKDIIDNCFIKNKNVSSRQIPSKFRFRNEMPLTINGKIDFKKLASEELTGDEITVVIKETNISIDGIEIKPPKHKTKVKK